MESRKTDSIASVLGIITLLLTSSTGAQSALDEQTDPFTDERHVVMTLNAQGTHNASKDDAQWLMAICGEETEITIFIKPERRPQPLLTQDLVDVKLRFDKMPMMEEKKIWHWTPSPSGDANRGAAVRELGGPLMLIATQFDKLLVQVGISQPIRFDLKAAREDLRGFVNRCKRLGKFSEESGIHE